MTMIRVVRDELKGEIDAVNDKVEHVATDVDAMRADLNSFGRSVERLTGEVSTTNRLIPQMLETIAGELRAKRTIDEQVVMSQVQVKTHREITAIDDASMAKRTKWRSFGRVVAAVTGPALIGALATLLATHC